MAHMRSLAQRLEVRQGDALERLREMPDGSVQTCVTSPPYWGLRDYRIDGQLGLEATPEEYVANMVEVFREVKRVLRDDGTLWLNLGDSYAARGYSGGMNSLQKPHQATKAVGFRSAPPGLKSKDIVGIPWRVAFALQEDGWYLRSDIIWHKPNPMPESVTDRPTRAHEYIFLLTKSATYYYDSDAIAEATVLPDSIGQTLSGWGGQKSIARPVAGVSPSGNEKNNARYVGQATRNRRTVWTITAKPYSGAHFATFPPELPEVCIKAGSSEGNVVLDPFSGAGTTGMVAARLGRSYVGIELNPDYARMSNYRIVDDCPLFNSLDGE